MIKVLKNELRIDETVLKYATDKELTELRSIAKAIAERVQKCSENDLTVFQ